MNECVSSPSGVWGNAPAGNYFGAFWGHKNATLLIVLCTWFILPCSSLSQQSSQNFCIFRVAINYHPIFGDPLCWCPGVNAPGPYQTLLLPQHVLITSCASFVTFHFKLKLEYWMFLHRTVTSHPRGVISTDAEMHWRRSDLLMTGRGFHSVIIYLLQKQV